MRDKIKKFLLCCLSIPLLMPVQAEAEGKIQLLGNYTETKQEEAMQIKEQMGIEKVISIPDVFGDGEKVAAVAVYYKENIAPKSLDLTDFEVEGRQITKIYTNNEAKAAEQEEKGQYVIVELAYTNSVPSVPEAKKKRANTGTDAPMRSDRKAPDLTSKIKQIGDVWTESGKKIGGSDKIISSTEVAENITDAFTKHVYTDPVTNYSIPYHIYLPKDYDSAKSYPLLFFVADASANINNDDAVLFQGNGATIWATEEEQNKHEAIILAPQYTQDMVDPLGMLTTDSHEWGKGLELVTSLLHHVIDSYAVDKDRIYGTGQSQGGMTNIAISIKYPDLFAAQYFVASQWDVPSMDILKDKKLWILVSEGDTKAYPAMNEATMRWEQLGTKVARDVMWDSTSNEDEFTYLVSMMRAQQAPINYSVFKGGTHMYTWSVAYNIEGIRDWLFSQTKSGKPVSQTESGQYMVEKKSK